MHTHLPISLRDVLFILLMYKARLNVLDDSDPLTVVLWTINHVYQTWTLHCFVVVALGSASVIGNKIQLGSIC
jgi:hypothetical protein